MQEEWGCLLLLARIPGGTGKRGAQSGRPDSAGRGDPEPLSPSVPRWARLVAAGTQPGPSRQARERLPETGHLLPALLRGRARLALHSCLGQEGPPRSGAPERVCRLAPSPPPVLLGGLPGFSAGLGGQAGRGRPSLRRKPHPAEPGLAAVGGEVKIDGRAKHTLSSGRTSCAPVRAPPGAKNTPLPASPNKHRRPTAPTAAREHSAGTAGSGGGPRVRRGPHSQAGGRLPGPPPAHSPCAWA